MSEPIYQAVNPTTEEVLETVPTATDAEVEAAVETVAGAFQDWCERPLATRADALRKAADALEARASELARIMAEEMGKPLAQGVAEANKCAWACRFYAEHAAEFLRPSPRDSDGTEALVRYDPLGPVLAIMPWNFPFWQFFRFAAPGLMAGNTALLKHAPGTPRAARTMVALLHEAGVPEGAAQNLYLSDDQAAALIADRRVAGVTLTGSTRAGREVAATAGGHLKPMVLELGGSDPFVVLDDADVDRAAQVGVEARCTNSGQSCIAAKRFVVHDAVYDRFADAFVERMRAKVTGDPLADKVDIGPLARADLRDLLARQVDATRRAGGRVLLGGEVPEGRGWFYLPTVLADVPDDAPAACEELFGPVATLFRVGSEDEAVALANRTSYGLGASLWTSDKERAERLVPRLEAGAVFVNGMVKSDPRLPFGGVKDSGFGRELAREGILEFVNPKTVWMQW